MKTLTVVSASNLNPRYLDCVPLWFEFWELQPIDGWKVVPHLFLVASELPVTLTRWAENITILPADGLSSAFVAQNIRTIGARNFPDSSAVMTTDIDMLPMHPRVLAYALKGYDENTESFIILRNVIEHLGEYPICYNIASPRTWGRIFNAEISDIDYCHSLFNEATLLSGYSGTHGGSGWTTDQTTLFKLVSQWESSGNAVLKFQDSQTGHRRLDRYWLRPWNIWLALALVRRGMFTDFHMLLPVAEHSRFYLRLLANYKTLCSDLLKQKVK
jgi:hypothetical protein